MDVPKREWKPPVEAENRGAWGGFIGRNVGLVLGVLVLYFLFSFVTGNIFQPRYEILSVVASEDPVAPGEPLRLALKVRNDRWKEGAAYVVLVIEGETEIEGPVTPVPSREEAEVAVVARLPSGWRSGTLLLYDAFRENVRVDAKHGIPIRVGKPAIEVLAADFPPRISAGETLVIRIHASNLAGQVPVRVVPLAIFAPDTTVEGAKSLERSGRSALLGAGTDSDAMRLEARTGDLDPGPYFVSVTLTDPASGRRIGSGMYHLPIRVLPGPARTP